MQLVTTRSLIRSVADLWKDQFLDEDGWLPVEDGSSKDINTKLAALDLANCDAREVDAIIGNTSWTTVQCSECRSVVGAVVSFNDGDDSADICADCLRGALELLEAQS